MTTTTLMLTWLGAAVAITIGAKSFAGIVPQPKVRDWLRGIGHVGLFWLPLYDHSAFAVT